MQKIKLKLKIKLLQPVISRKNGCYLVSMTFICCYEKDNYIS